MDVDEPPSLLQLDRERNEALLGAVMELTLDPAAIGCGGQHQPLPRGVEFGELRSLRLDRVVVALDPEQRPHTREQLVVVERLRDEVVSAGFARLPAVARALRCRRSRAAARPSARAPGRASALARPHPRLWSPRACCTPWPAARRGRASCSSRCPRRQGCAHPPLRPAFSIGSVNTKRLPCPDWLSTQMRPRCSSTRRFESASPRPVPSRCRTPTSVCWNSSKIRSWSSAAIPGPVSVTDTSTSPSSR